MKTFTALTVSAMAALVLASASGAASSHVTRPPDLPVRSGYMIIVTYGPTCSIVKSRKVCGMNPLVGATVKLFPTKSSTAVATGKTNSGGTIKLTIKNPTLRYKMKVTGKIHGRPFIHTTTLPKVFPGTYLPFTLSICVSGFC